MASISTRAIPRPAGAWLTTEIRQKAAFDWPLVTCAVALRVEGGKVAEASVWLGAVAPTPLRCEAAEAVLTGKAFDEALAAQGGRGRGRGGDAARRDAGTRCSW